MMYIDPSGNCVVVTAIAIEEGVKWLFVAAASYIVLRERENIARGVVNTVDSIATDRSHHGYRDRDWNKNGLPKGKPESELGSEGKKILKDQNDNQTGNFNNNNNLKPGMVIGGFLYLLYEAQKNVYGTDKIE